ncbi:5-hydroxytryptamine receptor 3D [Dirofilaria immitis]
MPDYIDLTTNSCLPLNLAVLLYTVFREYMNSVTNRNGILLASMLLWKTRSPKVCSIRCNYYPNYAGSMIGISDSNFNKGSTLYALSSLF